LTQAASPWIPHGTPNLPWTESTRREYRRTAPRCKSDVTDREWALIERIMPPPKPLAGREQRSCEPNASSSAVASASCSMAGSCTSWPELPGGAGWRQRRRRGRGISTIAEQAGLLPRTDR